MQDRRTHQSIAARFDLEFHQRPSPSRRRWRWLLALALVAPLGLLGFFLARDDKTIYWAGPLSDAHVKKAPQLQAGRNCSVCHTQTSQPFWRLVHGNDEQRCVISKSCEGCHPQHEAIHHNPLVEPNFLRDCVVCHTEHRGNEQLRLVRQGHCAACHAHLKTNPPGQNSFVARITSFDAHTPHPHPEFALRDASPDRLPGPAHGIHQRAKRVDGRWADKSAFKFNHQYHLREEGVKIPPMHPAASTQGEKKLACQDCHVPDKAGEFKQPIRYATHCADCHPLYYAEITPVGQPLPHGNLQAAFDTARGRLRKEAQRLYDELRPESGAEPPRLPGRPQEPPPKNSAEWIERYLQEHLPRLLWWVKKDCAKCHLFTDETPDRFDGVAVIDPKLPQTWFPQSRFTHAKHADCACVVCHDPEYLKRAETKLNFLGAAQPDKNYALTSQHASDILIPSIEVCRKCHAANPAWPRPASFECFRCHAYHHVGTLGARGGIEN